MESKKSTNRWVGHIVRTVWPPHLLYQLCCSIPSELGAFGPEKLSRSTLLASIWARGRWFDQRLEGPDVPSVGNPVPSSGRNPPQYPLSQSTCQQSQMHSKPNDQFLLAQLISAEHPEVSRLIAKEFWAATPGYCARVRKRGMLLNGWMKDYVPELRTNSIPLL
jgi:hypothetical protein